MIFITSYDRLNEGVKESIEFLFDPLKEQLFQKINGQQRLMGKPENYVFPHVPKPQNMRSSHAKKLTVFCKEWIINKDKLRELNHDNSCTT